MDRLQALKELADKVEAGTWADLRITGLKQADLSEYASEFLRAYHGSLDAAKALHDAVLPDTPVKIVDHSQDHMGGHGWYVFVNWPHTLWMPHYTTSGPFSYRGMSDTPARAWLLAIIEALRAREDRG